MHVFRVLSPRKKREGYRTYRYDLISLSQYTYLPTPPIPITPHPPLPHLPALTRDQAVIQEGLRMVSPVVMGFPKRVPAGGDTIDGKFVPAGTDVFVNFWSMLRNRDTFGEDADVFRPERFLECDEVKRAYLAKNVDLAFGHGRWMCPGKTLAWIELNKIFVEVCGVLLLPPLHTYTQIHTHSRTHT